MIDGLWFIKCNVCREANLRQEWIRPNHKAVIASLACRSVTNDEREDMEILYSQAKRHYMLDGHDWFSIIKSMKGQHDVVKEFSLIQRQEAR